MGLRIAILWHRRQDPASVRGYLIDHLADYWRDEGIRVTHLFGTGRTVPADALVVHVDRTLVPDSYLRFARRYPVVLNAGLRDIRKTTHSVLRLTRDADYAGPVIVKTDRNHGGRPELQQLPVGGPWRTSARVQRHWAARCRRAGLPYRIFDTLAEVPSRYFRDRRWIVERFVPEFEHGRYHVRNLHIFGGRASCVRLSADHPLIENPDDGIEVVEPHPAMLERAIELGMDFGKLDYVVHDGQAFLLDVNKTVGAVPPPVPAKIVEGRRRQARGIYDYLGETARHTAMTPAARSAS